MLATPGCVGHRHRSRQRRRALCHAERGETPGRRGRPCGIVIRHHNRIWGSRKRWRLASCDRRRTIGQREFRSGGNRGSGKSYRRRQGRLGGAEGTRRCLDTGVRAPGNYAVSMESRRNVRLGQPRGGNRSRRGEVRWGSFRWGRTKARRNSGHRRGSSVSELASGLGWCRHRGCRGCERSCGQRGGGGRHRSGRRQMPGKLIERHILGRRHLFQRQELGDKRL